MTNIDHLNSSISQAFDVLLTSLTNEQLNVKVIERQFNELFGQITTIEGLSYAHFVEHRYRYHKIHLAYYEKLKDEIKIKIEEPLLRKYASLRSQYPVTETLVEINEISNEEMNYDFKSSWENILNLVASLTQLQDTDEITNVLKRIRKLFIPIFKHNVRTLDEYFILQNNCRNIQNLFETLKANEFDIILDVGNDEKSNYFDLLTEIIDFVSNGLEDRQVYFVNILLSDLPRLNEMLFDNIPQTEQCITHRYREWARIFHSDKHCSNPIFDELMKNVNCIRDRHLSKIHSLSAKLDIVKNEIDEGHKHAELSITFKKRFKSGGDEELTVEQLEKLFSFEALTAFQHYRAALKSLGKMNQDEAHTIQRAEILEWMALMMRQTGNHNIEAQLYIVAAIYIITLSTNMTDQLYKRLKKLQEALEKYQDLAKNTVNEINNMTSTNTHRELVLCTNPRLSPREIHDETQVFIREAILRKCVIRVAQPNELSVESKSVSDSSFRTSTNRYLQVCGFVVGAFIPVLAVGILFPSCSSMWNAIAFSYAMSKTASAEDVSAEYTIRSDLNILMKEAVNYYNSKQYAKFIHRLSMPYYGDRQLMDTKFGSETISIEIRVDQIIRPLLKHGFRADKIAHLLILIGEVLLRGIDFADRNRTNPEHTALLEQSKILFQGIYDSSQLTEAATKLDKRIEKYHHQKIRKFTKQIFDPISKKDIDDSHEALFSNRLAGYCRLARLNYAIACLLAGGKDNFERCKQSLKALKRLEDTHYDRFFVIPDERIQALEDLLSAFGMDDDNSDFANSTNMLALASNIPIDIINIEYLKTLVGYHACKIVEEVNDEDDQLVMLARLVSTKHAFDCEIFIQYVLNKYSNTDQLILELLRQEHVSNLSEWAVKFRLNRKVFQHRAYLPILSAFGNMKIQPCNVAYDKTYGVVFVTSHSLIDCTPGNSEPHDLFVVVLRGQDHISYIFNVMPIEISHLHWALRIT